MMESAAENSSPLRTTRHTATTIITISPTIFDLFHFLYTHTKLCLVISWNLLAQPAFSTHRSLVRTSNLLVLCHYADIILEQHIIQQQDIIMMKGGGSDRASVPTSLYYFYTNATATTTTSSSASTALPPQLMNNYAWWMGGAAIMVSGVLLIVLVIVAQQQQEQWVLSISVVSLFLLEAVMLPLCVIVCTSLYLLQQVRWTTVLLLLCMIWSALTILAHYIRCTLYQNLQRRRRRVV